MAKSLAIAIVDDLEFISKGIKDHLSSAFPELRVSTFISGDAFLEELKRGNDFGAVIMDGKFPGGFLGPYYISEALSRSPHTVFIGFSTDDSAAVQKEFKEAGAKYFLPKNAPYEKIDGLLRKILGL